MNRLLSILIVAGIIFWIFVVWDRSRPDQFAEEHLDDSTRSERCLAYRESVKEAEEDDRIWTLGYTGRIQQLIRGCY